MRSTPEKVTSQAMVLGDGECLAIPSPWRIEIRTVSCNVAPDVRCLGASDVKLWGTAGGYPRRMRNRTPRTLQRTGQFNAVYPAGVTTIPAARADLCDWVSPRVSDDGLRHDSAVVFSELVANAVAASEGGGGDVDVECQISDGDLMRKRAIAVRTVLRPQPGVLPRR